MKLLFTSAVFVAALVSATSIEDQVAISTPSKAINTSFFGYIESLVASTKEKEGSSSDSGSKEVGNLFLYFSIECNLDTHSNFLSAYRTRTRIIR